VRKILALDLGTTTGWAVGMPDGAKLTGTQSFKPGRFDGGGMRYLRFTQWLDDHFDTVHPLNYVCFEEVRRHLGVDAAHAYGGFLAHLTSWCERRRIPYEGVTVQAIKIQVTGKGNTKKEGVMEAVRKLGYQPADDNEADACALLQWAIANGRWQEPGRKRVLITRR